MAITWDDTGKRLYETGVKNGVLYPFNKQHKGYFTGVPWNGLTAVTESPSGAEESPIYADDIKYLSLRSAEEFGATVEAYTYPDEFAVLDGSAEIAPGVMAGQQSRGIFGLSYRTIVGNDEELDDHGYKLHLIYGATASPSERAYNTVNDSPEAITFSWELSTTPVKVAGFKPTSCLTIDSTKTTPEKMAALEKILYEDSYALAEGVTQTNFAEGEYFTKTGENYTKAQTWSSSAIYYIQTGPRLPMPEEVIAIMGV